MPLTGHYWKGTSVQALHQRKKTTQRSCGTQCPACLPGPDWNQRRKHYKWFPHSSYLNPPTYIFTHIAGSRLSQLQSCWHPTLNMPRTLSLEWLACQHLLKRHCHQLLHHMPHPLQTEIEVSKQDAWLNYFFRNISASVSITEWWVAGLWQELEATHTFTKAWYTIKYTKHFGRYKKQMYSTAAVEVFRHLLK